MLLWNFNGGHIILADSFIMSLIYIFCKKNPNQMFMFMFIFKIKAKYFPFAYMAFRTIQGGGFFAMLVGILAGHAYLYLKEILPLSTGKQYLISPPLLYSYCFFMIIIIIIVL